MKCKILFLIAIFCLATFGYARLAYAQTYQPPTPTSTPTPLAGRALAVPFSVNLLLDSDPLRVNQTFQATLRLDSLQATPCYGIPAFPVDLFFVVDNSGSAGNGEPGSNLAATRALIQDFITQSDQDIYIDPDYANLLPQRSRIGLVSSNLTTVGIEIGVLELTENLQEVRQAVEELEPGGDSDLAMGIQTAASALMGKGRRVSAVPVIVLVLHDDVPITDTAIKAALDASRQGIELYIIENTQYLGQPENAASADDAERMGVKPNYFLLDPTSLDLRRAFIQMSRGSTEWIAKDLYVVNQWPDFSIEIISVAPDGLRVAGEVAWRVDHLSVGERVETSYEAVVLDSEDGVIETIVHVAYIDCNGYWQYVSYPFLVQVGASPTETPTPVQSATKTPRLTATSRSVSLTSTPAVSDRDAGGFDIPSPFELPGWRTLFSFLQPILADLPVLLQWLIPLLLLLLLIALLLWLLWTLWRRQRPVLEPVNPPPGKGDEGGKVVRDCVPAWIKRLTEERRLLMPLRQEKADFKDTLLVGIGPAGRQVLAQVAEALHSRFGEKIPSNVRLLQLDVAPRGTGDPALASPPVGLKAEQWVLLQPDLSEMRENVSERPENWAHWKWFSGSEPTYDRTKGRAGIFYDLRNGTDNSALWTSLRNALTGLDTPDVRVIGTTFDEISSGMLIDVARLIQLVAQRDLDVQLWLAGPTKWNERNRLLPPGEQSARTLATLREIERFQRNAPVSFNYVSSNILQDELRQVHRYAVVQSVFVFESAPGSNPEDDVLACMADCLLALLHSRARDALIEHLRVGKPKADDIINSKYMGMVSALGGYAVRVPVGPLARAVAWRMVREALFEDAIGLVPIERLNADGEYTVLDESVQRFSSSAYRDEIQQLVDRYDRRWETEEFGAVVCLRLNDILNGESEGDEPTIKRRDGLARAIAWLNLLRTVLNQSGARRVASGVENLLTQARQMDAWLRETAYPYCKQQHEAARQRLDSFRKQPGRFWMIGDRLEWSFYQESIRPWGDKPSKNVSGEPLLRLAQRFGWQVHHSEGTWQLRFLAPKGDFVWQGQTNLAEYALGWADNAAGLFLQAIFSLAEPLANLIENQPAILSASKQNMGDWWKKAAPRLRYNEAEASSVLKNNHTALLVAEKSEAANRMRDALTAVGGNNANLQLCETEDISAVTLMRVVDYIPMKWIQLYDDDAWRQQTVLPSMYVWRAEQLAAEVEEQEQLSPRFLGYLAQDDEILYWFGMGVLYGAFERGRESWSIPGFGEIQGDSECRVLQKLFDEALSKIGRGRDAALNTLQQAVMQGKQRVAERKLAYLREVERSLVQRLEQSQDRCERDLGRYLHGLINRERG